ncbi:hypothetical protein GCM10007103_16000 [Salinimicrobium marinum]|uniref:Uncharacterized protein n=1 Tax=Salinimicrobium marinum TaxID=680283 RepID=A0A918VXQ9_9FLAO|nr:hypothetical protein [Salinimicrobium marinum]GHA35252.1 hypothetical protein GCM10007103_16000 [Salinimicrobium marinum]
MSIRIFLFFLLVTITSSWVRSQETSHDYVEVYKDFDSIFGLENTSLFHGVEYIEEHRMVNEKQKFFKTRYFTKARIEYDGKVFYDVPAKYSIWDDELLVSVEGKTRTSIFKLLENRLTRFNLFSQEFVNIYSPESSFSGIYELLLENSLIQVLKKHSVREKKISENRYIHYEFEPVTPKYFFLYEGEVKEVTRKNILAAFPEQTSLVREKFRIYRNQPRHLQEQSIVNMFESIIQTPKNSSL